MPILTPEIIAFRKIVDEVIAQEQGHLKKLSDLKKSLYSRG